jgi:hypothetical protein
MDDPDSIESIIRFIEEKNPNQIRTFLNLGELKTELKKIQKELYSELEIRHGSNYDDIEDDPDMQTIQNYIDLIDENSEHYAESLDNYNRTRINRITTGQINAMNTRRTTSEMSFKPERTKGGRKGRRTRHRKKSRRTRHRRKGRRTRHRRK